MNGGSVKQEEQGCDKQVNHLALQEPHNHAIGVYLVSEQLRMCNTWDIIRYFLEICMIYINLYYIYIKIIY